MEQTAEVIILKVPDDLSAFVMFETLNDRGLKTSQADLVKNYLFGEAADRIQEAHRLWASMAGALETMEAEDIVLTYLRHLVSSLQGVTRDREVFDRIKGMVAGKSQAISLLQQMADNASDYVAILTPSHAKWTAYFSTARVAKNSLARYYLRSMELQVQGNPEPEFIPNENEQVINLEHVLPENPGPGWAHVDPETAAAFHRRVGNMALLQVTKNIKIGNDAFATKQPVLKASLYKLTNEIAAHTNWGMKEITERQKQLAKIAVKTWPLTIR